MKLRGHRDPRVIPFPTPTRDDRPKTPQHRFIACDGLIVVCPQSRELLTWSRLMDPTSWNVGDG